ncbi:MAG: DNA polymerase III subunit [Pirellulaceae bacterium]|nr:DNA polymerase III subunit [Pirellulaceae bacterium]
MLWRDYQGHLKQKKWFQQAIRQNRLASTFLMVGPDGCGKRTFSRLIAKALLCPNRDSGSLDPCQSCESCVQIDADTHPDLLQVCKPPEASSLSIELLVGSRENRLREGLCYELHMKPYHGQRRIAIIDDADTIHVEAANSMLKTLEEPPVGAAIFLISSNEQRQLSTIRSRSQIVRFQGLSSDVISTLLIRNGLVDNKATADAIAKLADGSYARAQAFLDNDLREFRAEIRAKLAERPFDFIAMSKAIVANIESAGKEGALRRARLKTIFSIAIEFYRSIIYQQAGHVRSLFDGEEAKLGLPISVANRALEICVAAQGDVDRNVTPAALLESWSTELAEICRA